MKQPLTSGVFHSFQGVVEKVGEGLRLNQGGEILPVENGESVAGGNTGQKALIIRAKNKILGGQTGAAIVQVDGKEFAPQL